MKSKQLGRWAKKLGKNMEEIFNLAEHLRYVLDFQIFFDDLMER